MLNSFKLRTNEKERERATQIRPQEHAMIKMLKPVMKNRVCAFLRNRDLSWNEPSFWSPSFQNKALVKAGPFKLNHLERF